MSLLRNVRRAVLVRRVAPFIYKWQTLLSSSIAVVGVVVSIYLTYSFELRRELQLRGDDANGTRAAFVAEVQAIEADVYTSLKSLRENSRSATAILPSDDIVMKSMANKLFLLDIDEIKAIYQMELLYSLQRTYFETVPGIRRSGDEFFVSDSNARMTMILRLQSIEDLALKVLPHRDGRLRLSYPTTENLSPH